MCRFESSAPCQKINKKQSLGSTDLFLSEPDLQLDLSLNNLQLFFLPPPAPHCCFRAAALHVSWLQVAGIKGVFLSNKVVENQVKTYITYNKGRDWHLLRAPAADLQGNKLDCEQVSGLLPVGPSSIITYKIMSC